MNIKNFSMKIQKEQSEEASETQIEEWTREYIRTYMSYEKEIDQRKDEIKEYRESFREWEKDFLNDKSIPKKELSQAIQILKKNLDYKVISDMVGAMETEVD